MIAQVAVMAASTAMQYSQAKAQANYTAQSNEVAKQEYTQQVQERQDEAQRQQQQAYEADQSEQNQLQAQAMRDRATLDTLLGEYGGGGTADRRLATLGVRQGQDLATVQSNQTKQAQELGFSERADVHNIQLASASSQKAVVQPSGLGAALQIGSAALSAGRQYNALQNPHPKSGIN